MPIVAGGPGRDTEIARELRSRGNKRDAGGRIRACFPLLAARKEKQLVLKNRPANGPSPLVLLQSIARGGEKAPGIEISVANKIEQIAMKAVCAGLGDGIYCRGRMKSILREAARWFRL